MRIQARGVNVKRHTTHYKIGGKWRTRAEAVRLARQKAVEGVVIRRGSNDEAYLATAPYSYPSLYDLPVLTQKEIRRNQSH